MIKIVIKFNVNFVFKTLEIKKLSKGGQVQSVAAFFLKSYNFNVLKNCFSREKENENKMGFKEVINTRFFM